MAVVMSAGRTMRTFFRVLFACVALTGCSLKLQIALFNDAGEPVMVRLGDKSLGIEPEHSRLFDYPGENEHWTLHLSAAGCDYTYSVPRTLEHYPMLSKSSNPLKVQVENNLDIYLLPPSATTVAAAAGLAQYQQSDFPLRPQSKACPDAREG